MFHGRHRNICNQKVRNSRNPWRQIRVNEGDSWANIFPIHQNPGQHQSCFFYTVKNTHRNDGLRHNSASKTFGGQTLIHEPRLGELKKGMSPQSHWHKR